MYESFDLEIHLGNDAMQTREDVAAALRVIADKIDATDLDSGATMDLNGNVVGHYGFTRDES